MSEPTYQPMPEGTEDKNLLLKQFSSASGPMRKKFMRLAEQQGFVDATELTQARDEAFFGCCVADMRALGLDDTKIKEFASRLSRLPNDELDFLVVLCTEVDKGAVRYVPGFTRHVSKLLASLPAPTLQ